MYTFTFSWTLFHSLSHLPPYTFFLLPLGLLSMARNMLVLVIHCLFCTDSALIYAPKDRLPRTVSPGLSGDQLYILLCQWRQGREIGGCRERSVAFLLLPLSAVGHVSWSGCSLHNYSAHWGLLFPPLFSSNLALAWRLTSSIGFFSST